MFEEWLLDDGAGLWFVVASSIVVFLAVILAVRLNGLRTFSKMSGFDFAMTVSVGSLMAGVATTSTALLPGLIALAVIVGTQRFVAMARRRGDVEWLVDNSPMVLMVGSSIIEENMARARVTPADLRAKLREANVLRWSQVQAVVLETTGDISVLHGDALDPSLLEGVIGAELYGRA